AANTATWAISRVALRAGAALPDPVVGVLTVTPLGRADRRVRAPLSLQSTVQRSVRRVRGTAPVRRPRPTARPCLRPGPRRTVLRGQEPGSGEIGGVSDRREVAPRTRGHVPYRSDRPEFARPRHGGGP